MYVHLEEMQYLQSYNLLIMFNSLITHYCVILECALHVYRLQTTRSAFSYAFAYDLREITEKVHASVLEP